MMRTFMGGLLMAGVCTAAMAAGPQKITGLKTPESVVAGADGRIYVSEIGEFGKDGDGQIRVIDRDGSGHVFAVGMDDPKGLAFYGNDLYVADRMRVLKVGLDGRWQVFAQAAAFPQPPLFLNDLEADTQGNLYVSDTGDMKGKGGAVYRVGRNGKVSTVVSGERDARVQGPNGLLMDGQGALLEADFVSGTLYRIKLRSGEMEKLAEGLGGADGVVRGPRGTLYVSDWKNGKVFAVGQRGDVRVVREGYAAAADIGLSRDGKFLLVPDMKAGELHWLPLGE